MLAVAALCAAAALARAGITPAAPPVWEAPPDSRQRVVPTATLAGARRAAEQAASEARIATEPLRRDERLDPNRASEAELERLPRVGPALARRIVAHRESGGTFRSLADLDSIPGVGPALLGSLAPHLTLPVAPTPPARVVRPGPGGPLELNRASAADLEALPGVGPVLATRIVASREREGPFRDPADLERVPGIGPKLRKRLEPHLRFGF